MMPTLDDRWAIVTAQRERLHLPRDPKTSIPGPSGDVYPRSAAEPPVALGTKFAEARRSDWPHISKSSPEFTVTMRWARGWRVN